MTQTIFTLGEAAIVTGYAKSKISKDLHSGKLSYREKDPGGQYKIDASELIRTYGDDRVKPERLENRSQKGSENDGEPLETPENAQALQAEITVLRERISMLGQMHEAEVRHLSARIEDLRASEEDAKSQRDETMKLLKDQISLTRLLTDQRPKDTIPMPPPAGEVTKAAGAGRGGFFGFLRR